MINIFVFNLFTHPLDLLRFYLSHLSPSLPLSCCWLWAVFLCVSLHFFRIFFEFSVDLSIPQNCSPDEFPNYCRSHSVRSKIRYIRRNNDNDKRAIIFFPRIAVIIRINDNSKYNTASLYIPFNANMKRDSSEIRTISRQTSDLKNLRFIVCI